MKKKRITGGRLEGWGLGCSGTEGSVHNRLKGVGGITEKREGGGDNRGVE